MSAIDRRFLLAAAAAALPLAACHKGGAAGTDSVGDEMVLGNPNAKVTVVEYASAACPHCAEWEEENFATFKKKYIDTGRVKFVFREFLTPPVQAAAAGFLLARCAGKDKYFQVLDAVFRSQKDWGVTGDVHGAYLRVAQTFGMNEKQFDTCVTDEEQLKKLNDRVTKFSDQDHVDSTPTFIINGKKTAGEMPMAQLDAAIVAAEAGK